MARKLVSGAAAGLALAAIAVVLPFGDHVRVVEGNLRYLRGELPQAIVSYRRVTAGERSPYATYNLATTYAAAGEPQASERLLAELNERVTDPDLLFRIRFTGANLAFARGDYVAAVLGFRGALAIRSGDHAAKHNLEVALRRLAARPPAAVASQTSSDDQAALSDGAQQLLRFAVQQEDTTWGSRGSEPAAADSW